MFSVPTEQPRAAACGGAWQHGRGARGSMRGARQHWGPFSLHAVQGPVEQTPQLSVRLWPRLTQLIQPQPLSQSPVPCQHLPLDEPCLHISRACFETAWLSESRRSRDWMPGLVPVGQHRLWRRGLRRPQAEPLRGIFKQRAPDASRPAGLATVQGLGATESRERRAGSGGSHL